MPRSSSFRDRNSRRALGRPLGTAAEAFTSSELHNHQRLLDRPTCYLSIVRRTIGCIGYVYEGVECGRQVLSDLYLFHRGGP